MFPTKVVQKVKTYTVRSVTVFPPESLAVCEIMWRNLVHWRGHRSQGWGCKHTPKNL